MVEDSKSEEIVLDQTEDTAEERRETSGRTANQNGGRDNISSHIGRTIH